LQVTIFRGTSLIRALMFASLLAVPTASARADAPTVVNNPLNLTVPIPSSPFTCPFDVQVQLTGYITDTYRDGVLSMVHFHFITTFSNPSTGKAISSTTDLTRTHIVFSGDGTTATVTDTGIDGVFTVPGVGNVGAVVGRGTAIIPAAQAPGITTGPVIPVFQAGQFTGVFPSACPYLH